MEKSEGSYQQEVSRNAAHKRRVVLNSLEQLHAPVLEGESFEEAEEALTSLETLQEFRKKTNRLPFGSFHEIVEEATNLNRLPLSGEERTDRMEDMVRVIEQSAPRLSPRVADLYLAILAEISNDS